MSKQKRMVYIYDENLEFYNNLDNKSEFVNQCIAQTRLAAQRTSDEEVTDEEVAKEPEPQTNIDYIRDKISNMGK